MVLQCGVSGGQLSFMVGQAADRCSSSAEVEYRAVANGVAEATWLRQLLHELQTLPSRCTIVYCDNINVVYLFTKPVQHQRTKYVEIDFHFVREKVAIG
jgi:hypothetical protein